MTPPTSARARGEPGCGCGLRYRATQRNPKRRSRFPKQNDRHPEPLSRQTRLTMKQKSKPQQATDKTGVTMANDILIVDDEADIRDLVAGILDGAGFTTRCSRDSDSDLAEIV